MELTEKQKEAVGLIDGNLQIIACAGSGKTEVISRRIANILRSKADVKPEHIVAFTFTEKAAAGLKTRIETAAGMGVEGMYIGTIHGFCKHLLSKYVERFADFKVLDTVKNHLFITRYADRCGMTELELKPCLMNNGLFLQCIEKLIDDYDNRANWQKGQLEILEKYTECLYSHQYIDFSLLIFEALRQIRENPVVQAYLQNIRYLIVDEYQDVDDLQEKLISAMVGFGANICVVGDDDQTIYQFRGSNAENMIAFPERYPNVHQVRLEDNFRCQAGIVDVAANVIRHNERRLEKTMRSGADPADGTISAKGYSCTEDEFSAIAQQISVLHAKGIPYNEMAILVRKGKHIAPLTQVLERSSIPYRADSAEDFFKGNYFNRFVETLRMLDKIDKAALYEQWKDILSPEVFNTGFRYLRSCARGGSYRLSEILRGFCEKIDFLNPETADLSVRTEDLEGIAKILDDYDEIYGDYQLSARIAGVLRFFGLQVEQEYKYHSFRDQDAQEDAVHLMTVHKAKGLEFTCVFLPRLNKREFPVSAMGGRQYYHILGGSFAENKDRYASDIEDERKLFYVAVTRAKQHLFMSYTLAEQPVSEFVSNAAESAHLQINRSDLHYQPPKPERASGAHKGQLSEEEQPKREQEQLERAMYQARVKEAREALYMYYSAGNHFCRGIIMEYKEICKQGPDAILARAQECGLL